MLKNVGGLNNEELAKVFTDWNNSELKSFLIEITAIILAKKDDQGDSGEYLVDKVVDKTGAKGTGEWLGGCNSAGVHTAIHSGLLLPTVCWYLLCVFLFDLHVCRDVNPACVVLSTPRYVVIPCVALSSFVSH